MTAQSEMIGRIGEILTETGLSAFAVPDTVEKLGILLELLTEANRHMNLTAISEPEEIVLRHFADSLTAARFLPSGARVVDMGCGGGFPTLPLAIARPDLSFTALDSTAKKLTFVAAAAERLSLSVKTVAVRAEEYRDGREGFDVCLSRAVASLELLDELCLPLVKVGGVFVAMKGASGLEELTAAQKGIAVLGGKVREADPFTLSVAGKRVLIAVDKVRPTPKEYPRPWARIKKKPL